MSNLIQDIFNSLNTVPNAINTATGTVQKIDQRVDDVVEAAEVYAGASLLISAIAAFSALGLLILQARNSSGGGVFSRTPRTEVRSNPRKRKRRK